MTAAERDLGYRPVVRYDEAVRDTAGWLLEHVELRPAGAALSSEEPDDECP